MPNTWYHENKVCNNTYYPIENKEVTNSVSKVANVGDKIVTVKRHYASDFMLGDVFTVTEVNGESVRVLEDAQGIYHWEYEVVL